MLKLETVIGGYSKGQNVLNGVSIDVKQGDTLAVLGQNGSGKSSLAKAIVNTLPYVSGNIIYNGNNIGKVQSYDRLRSGIGFLMQGGRVFPHLNSIENLQLAGNLLSYRMFHNRIQELKSYFNLLQGNKIRLQASYLSGGEKHQLALAMVLINKQQLLILDEPSAGLSPENVENMYKILNTIRQREKVTILLIEQNEEKAIEFSSRVTLLQNGQLIEFDSHMGDLKKRIRDYILKSK